MKISEEGYKLGGSTVYGVYIKNNNIWELFDTINGDNEPEAISRYGSTVSQNKNKETIIIEYNAPNNIPQKLDNLDNKNIVFSNIKECEIYDENWLRITGLKNNEYSNTMNYTVHETKSALENIFYEEDIKIISEDKFDDDFINITMLIQHNPLVESSNIILDYADKKYGYEYIGEEIANILEHISGMELYEYTKLMREKESPKYSKSAHEWVKKQVDKLYPQHISNKEEAFGVAWKQYSKKDK